MTTPSDEPTAQAQAVLERLLAMVKDCRVVLPALERGAPWRVIKRRGGANSVIRTMEDALKVLTPCEPAARADGGEWLEKQARNAHA